MHLADVRQVVEGVQGDDFNAGVGFFRCFTYRAMGGSLVVFHETGGECPQAVARLDGAAAQQYLVFPLRDRAHHDLGVFIVDGAASIADIARQVISGLGFQFDFRAAMAAIIHLGTLPKIAVNG